MIRNNFKLSKAIVYAPLAGISDSPSRKLAVRFGADMTVSELISSEGIIRNSKKTLELAGFDNSERPIGLQLFGANPDSMAEAARILSSLNPDFIDLNFGCPARKVVGKNGGSSVLRNLKLFKEIVNQVINAVDLPVTVKMRSGWDSRNLTYMEAGKIAEDCGAAAVTLHSRTRAQGFTGKADWSQIAQLKNELTIPVIGNGDIKNVTDVKLMFDQTGCDGVMLGRVSIGNPWIFRRIKEYLKSGNIPPEPSFRERINLALEHFDMTLDEFGIPRAIYKMRSRFAWYLKGMPEASIIRARINRSRSVEEIKEIILGYSLDLRNNTAYQEAPGGTTCIQRN
ncbi:MAG: tRNA dihydrouridine synthase DusB [Candidatus Zixiibacteriota bacterium]|nr:MAG: tRNA dihydrouridine synthase DusB [candidate division Zixibacteria bacterium]